MVNEQELGRRAHTPRYVSASYVASLYDVTQQTIYKGAKEGTIPCVHIGRTIRFDLNEIEKWAAAGGSRE